MKAYSLKAVGDLRFEEMSIPVCKKGWCLVKVKYVGICSSDIPRIFQKGTYHFPTIPGHEFSGVVDSVADKENKALVGKKVGIFPLIPCKKCEACKSGKYEMCEHYDYIGSRRDGGFADYVAVPIWNLIVLDDTVSLKEAATMEPFAVALHAIKKASIAKNDSVCIVGTGMIALAAGQWARRMGAKSITIIGRSDYKRNLIEKSLGFKYQTINDEIEYADVVIEAVGSTEAIGRSIKTVRAGGRLVLMGNPSGDINLDQNTYWRILRKQINLVGTWNSSYENNQPCDWTEVRDAFNNHELEVEPLITHVFEKESLMDGLNLMREHKEPYCKVMIAWEK